MKKITDKRVDLWKGCLLLLIGGFYFFHPMMFVCAEDNGLGYTVDIIQPETQVDESKSFFNIQTRSGETQVIKAIVKSTKKEQTKLNIFVENANTSESGQISYTANKSLLDKSLTMPISDMVTVKTPEVSVQNFEEKIVEIEVRSPEEGYEGIKLGNISFQLNEEKKPNEVGVSSLFAYRIGLVTMEEDIDYDDSKSLKVTKVTPNILRGKKTVVVKFQNGESKILSNFELSYSLSKVGSKTPLKQKQLKNLNMAPNSYFNFPIDLGIGAVSSGKYNLKISVKNTHGIWAFDEEFTISPNDANKLNDQTVFKLVTPQWIKSLTIGFIGIITIVTISIFIRHKKWKREIIKLKQKRKKVKKKSREIL